MFLCVAVPMHINLDLRHSCYSSPVPSCAKVYSLFAYRYSSVSTEAEVIVNTLYSFSTFAFCSAGMICLVHGACYKGKGPNLGLTGTEIIP